jgi:hypothetical protein
MRFTYQDLPPVDSEKYLDIQIQRIDHGPGRCSVKVWRGKQSKPFIYYAFKTPEKREEYIEKAKRDAKEIWDYKEKRKSDKAEAKEAMVNPFQVGDIITNSWGYEQTNVDAYQVVELGKKSVKLRSIGQETVPGSEYEHGMACMVKPVRDKFLAKGTHENHYRDGNPPFTKILKAYKDRDGKIQVYLSFKYGSGTKWVGEGLYNSWYA